MLYLLFGFVLIWLVLGGLKAFAQASPAALARLVKRSGGAAALAIAAILLLRGGVALALGFAGLGFWLLNLGQGGARWIFSSPANGPGARGSGGRTGRGSGRASCVRSAMIEMELDHETGRMRGSILAGPDEGKELEFADAAAVRNPLRSLPSRRSGGRPTFAGLSRPPIFRLACGRRGSGRLLERRGAPTRRRDVEG